jgi:hypothetical protein
MTYDAAGNILSKTGVGHDFQYASGTNRLDSYVSDGYEGKLWDAIEYTSFNKISYIESAGKSMTLTYGPDKSRIMTVMKTGSTVNETKYYAGSYYEEISKSNGEVQKINYIFADGKTIAIFETSNKTANAVLGGTVSEIGGGKFANGAITAAFSMMFNEMMHDGGGDDDREIKIKKPKKEKSKAHEYAMTCFSATGVLLADDATVVGAADDIIAGLAFIAGVGCEAYYLYQKFIATPHVSPNIMLYKEHTKGARPSTESKHQKGQARKTKDNRDGNGKGEKGDKRRKYRNK